MVGRRGKQSVRASWRGRDQVVDFDASAAGRDRQRLGAHERVRALRFAAAGMRMRMRMLVMVGRGWSRARTSDVVRRGSEHHAGAGRRGH